MSLTNKDLEQINNLIVENNKKLMVFMAQNFLTKDEAASKKDLSELESRINNKISALQDTIVAMDAKFTNSIAMTDSRVYRIEEHLGLNS